MDPETETQRRPVGRPPVHRARNARMIAAFRSGRTLSEVAAAGGVTKMRASQIVRDAGLTRDDGGERVQRRLRELVEGVTCPVQLTPIATRLMRAAEARAGVSASEVIEYVIRLYAGSLVGEELGPARDATA